MRIAPESWNIMLVTLACRFLILISQEAWRDLGEAKGVVVILSNIETIPGKNIVRFFGVVSGSTVRAKNVGRDIAASMSEYVSLHPENLVYLFIFCLCSIHNGFFMDGV